MGRLEKIFEKLGELETTDTQYGIEIYSDGSGSISSMKLNNPEKNRLDIGLHFSAEDQEEYFNGKYDEALYLAIEKVVDKLQRRLT